VIHIKAKPIDFGEEQFKQAVNKVVREELLKGWKLGMQSMATTIKEKLNGVDESNYKEKIDDVIQYCNWALTDEVTKGMTKESITNNTKSEGDNT
jgi:hypothetical protein